jgi:D-inositol-3-phosphate glycosyltransferase
MNIAMVSEHASPLAVLGGVDAGGQNVHVAALARELGAAGNRVTVYTRRDDPAADASVPLAPNVVVRHVDAGPARPVSKDRLLPYMDDFADVLLRDWLRHAPDVVHSHFWMSGRAALAAARPLGIPVVHTFHALGVVKRRHQGDKDTSPPERLAEEEAIVRDASLLVATSSDEMFELARLGADLHRVRVVPCGVDIGHFRPDGPAQGRDGRPRVLVVCRLVERKGVGNVVCALGDVPSAELVIAGGPAAGELDEDVEATRLRQLAHESGVADRVRLLGRVDRADLPALIRSADVVACVPWYEPFGIVPLEAMACGVPVVASSVGGLVDTVVHDVTGVHVPPRRPDAVAAALRELLADPDRRRRLGAAGVQRVRRRFGWRRVAAATLEAYGLVLGRAGRLTEAVGRS